MGGAQSKDPEEKHAIRQSKNPVEMRVQGASVDQVSGMARDCPTYALEVSLRSALRLRAAHRATGAPLRMIRIGGFFNSLIANHKCPPVSPINAPAASYHSYEP